MITLLTGLPGNGKTLFAIWMVEAYRIKENKRLEEESKRTGCALVVREVFYSGITDLTLPWTVIDPTKWFECPHGSIIVTDEAQDTFPVKANGSQLPEHYELLAKHRHQGYDLFVITQHPTLIHNFVRKLVGRHFHSIRKFGLQRSTIYEWSATANNPETSSSHKSAIVLKWSYPKEVFSYYKSAELHTVKRSIPVKVILAVLFLVVFVGVFYFVLDQYQARARSAQLAVSGPGATVRPGGNGSLQGGSYLDPMADAKRFVFQQTPRVEGLVHTAPKYDEMTKPLRAPVPSICISKPPVCKCYSQQGTNLPVTVAVCVDIANNGFFKEFDEQPSSNQVAQQPPVGHQSATATASDSGVIFIPYVPPPPMKTLPSG